jgi:hypothetical protein
MREFTVDVTINYADDDKTIVCHPQGVYALKKLVEHFLEIERGATSFVFTVCETHKKELQK